VTAAAIPLLEKRVSITQPDEVVDFEIRGTALTGRVMDDEGYPVPGVDVTLRWSGGQVSTVTTKDGLFQLFLTETANADLSVSKKGYDTPPSQMVAVGPGGQTDLLTFVLKRR